MADFGSARLTSKHDPENPNAWAGDTTTRGWEPIVSAARTTLPSPRHVASQLTPTQEYRHNDGRRPRLTSSINIWQSAVVIRGLMQASRPNFDCQVSDMPVLDRLRGIYSPLLLKVVMDCLSPLPEKRPSPQDVLDAIEKRRESAFPGDEAAARGVLIEGVQMVDRYRVGMTFNGEKIGNRVVRATGLSGEGEMVDAPSAASSGRSQAGGGGVAGDDMEGSGELV